MAILGATSQIAKDLVLSLSVQSKYKLVPFEQPPEVTFVSND
jgi:hypothetical protein